MCMLCGQDPETGTHFLVECTALEEKMRPVMDSVMGVVSDLVQPVLDTDVLVQLLLDPSMYIDFDVNKHLLHSGRELEKLSKHLVHPAHRMLQAA